MDAAVELRQLRYFVAVAEELHFGRAADRLHMSQSPLSRAIRELERELGFMLFVRTTRRVELTAAGSVLLERVGRALADIDGAIADARRSAQAGGGVIGIGWVPGGRTVVTRIGKELKAQRPGLDVRLDEETTPESLRRIIARDLAAAVVLETPGAAKRHGVRIDTLRDEPLLAALPASHDYAHAEAIPLRTFVAERVLLPREPVGRAFNAWFRAVVRARGLELERTFESVSAPWDRRMLSVADGEVVGLFVGDWATESFPGVVGVPFDPPVNFPLNLASYWPSPDDVELLVDTACRLRDAGGWLTQRPARTDLPSD